MLLRSAIFASPWICFEILYILGDIYTRTIRCHLTRPPSRAGLGAAVAAVNKGAVRVLAPASSVIGGLDAARTLSAGLTLATVFRNLVSFWHPCLRERCWHSRMSAVGEWGKRTTRRKSSSPHPSPSRSSWAPCTCRRCRFRRARRGCCRTGGPSRRRQRSGFRRRGCCGSTQRPGWPLRPWWLLGNTVSLLAQELVSDCACVGCGNTHQSRRER